MEVDASASPGGIDVSVEAPIDPAQVRQATKGQVEESGAAAFACTSWRIHPWHFLPRRPGGDVADSAMARLRYLGFARNSAESALNWKLAVWHGACETKMHDAVHAEGAAVRVEPFADIDLPLAALWGD